MPETLAAVLERSVAALSRAGVPSPLADAELLLCHVLGLTRGAVKAKAISGELVEDSTEIDALVERRASREPLQHITGTAPFRSIELAVGHGVFVPRPETEGVAGIAIDALRAYDNPQPIAVDLGTGSGAIALAMAHEVPHARVYGVEVSPPAFVYTKQNFAAIAPDNATPVFVDLANALPELDGMVSVIASNPPYIPDAAIPRDPEVRLFDPEIALYGGEDGMDVIHDVSTTARRLLHPGGTLVIEHGELQAGQVAELLRADGWTAVTGHRDLLGRDRATTALR